MTADQVYQFLEYIALKESGVWKLKSKSYDVKIDGTCFLIKKRGGSANGAIQPLIKGQVVQTDFV